MNDDSTSSHDAALRYANKVRGLENRLQHSKSKQIRPASSAAQRSPCTTRIDGGGGMFGTNTPSNLDRIMNRLSDMKTKKAATPSRNNVPIKTAFLLSSPAGRTAVESFPEKTKAPAQVTVPHASDPDSRSPTESSRSFLLKDGPARVPVETDEKTTGSSVDMTQKSGDSGGLHHTTTFSPRGRHLFEDLLADQKNANKEAPQKGDAGTEDFDDEEDVVEEEEVSAAAILHNALLSPEGKRAISMNKLRAAKRSQMLQQQKLEQERLRMQTQMWVPTSPVKQASIDPLPAPAPAAASNETPDENSFVGNGGEDDGAVDYFTEQDDGPVGNYDDNDDDKSQGQTDEVDSPSNNSTTNAGLNDDDDGSLATAKTPRSKASAALETVQSLTERMGDVKEVNQEVRNLIESQVVDILNGGNKVQLMALYGVGPKRAQYIIDYREEYEEGFTEIGDLKEIGMSEKQVKKIAKVLVSNQLHST